MATMTFPLFGHKRAAETDSSLNRKVIIYSAILILVLHRTWTCSANPARRHGVLPGRQHWQRQRNRRSGGREAVGRSCRRADDTKHHLIRSSSVCLPRKNPEKSVRQKCAPFAAVRRVNATISCTNIIKYYCKNEYFNKIPVLSTLCSAKTTMYQRAEVVSVA